MQKTKMKPHELLWHNIVTLCREYGITQKEQQIIMRMSRATYHRRKANPETFTVKEVEAIAKRLNISVNKLFLESERVWSV